MYYYSQNLTPHQVVFFPLLLLAVAASTRTVNRGASRRSTLTSAEVTGMQQANCDGRLRLILRTTIYFANPRSSCLMSWQSHARCEDTKTSHFCINKSVHPRKSRSREPFSHSRIPFVLYLAGKRLVDVEPYLLPKRLRPDSLTYAKRRRRQR